jgi:hypothetical protein
MTVPTLPLAGAGTSLSADVEVSVVRSEDRLARSAAALRASSAFCLASAFFFASARSALACLAALAAAASRSAAAGSRPRPAG